MGSLLHEAERVLIKFQVVASPTLNGLVYWPARATNNLAVEAYFFFFCLRSHEVEGTLAIRIVVVVQLSWNVVHNY